MLTNAEIGHIERGLLNLAQVGDTITVPFSANKLTEAQVVWINERWFLQRQIDVTNPDVRRRLDHWLLDEYAYLVTDQEQPLSVSATLTKTFVADLYGNSEMATHGGSGRVGIAGCFQVKGIGRTPLVGTDVDWLHSHGCLWLEEALREAVYAEVAANEFPHGAVPVLAVIDTGLRLQMENGVLSEPRALSIRPVVIRPAHLERAVMFQPPGEEHPARLRDVRRVQQMVRHIEQEATTLQALFTEMVTRLAAQIAFSRAHRLFPGNYSSSNVSLEGELLDFGAFRALPNWCRYISLNDVAGFGNEVPELTGAIHSISFYVNKYKAALAEQLDPAALQQVFEQQLARTSELALLSLFNLEDVDDADLTASALATLLDYYSTQQKVEVRFQHSVKKKLRWFDEAIVADPCQADEFAFERKVLDDLLAAIDVSQLDGNMKELLCRRLWLSAARLLPARQDLLRSELSRTLHALIAEHGGSNAAEPAGAIEASVNAIIARSRRYWPRMPRHLLVLAQFSSPRCAVIYCLDPHANQYFFWLETVSIHDTLWYIDRWLPQSVFESYCTECDQRGWRGLLPANSSSAVAMVADIELRLPDNAVWFNTLDYNANKPKSRRPDLDTIGEQHA